MRKRRLLLEVKHNISLAESASSNSGLFVKNDLIGASQRRSVPNEGNKISWQELKILIPDYLRVAFPPKRGPGSRDLLLRVS